MGRHARPDGGNVFDRPARHTFTDQVILDAEAWWRRATGDLAAPTARVLDGSMTTSASGGILAVDHQAAVLPAA